MLTFKDFRLALLDYEFSNIVALYRQYQQNPEKFFETGPFYVRERLEAFTNRKDQYQRELEEAMNLPIPEEIGHIQKILAFTSNITGKLKLKIS